MSKRKQEKNVIWEDLVYLKEGGSKQQSDTYDVTTSPLQLLWRAPSIYYHSVFARILR